MATLNQNPFADFTVPAIYSLLGEGGGIGYGGGVVGLCPYTEGGGRGGASIPAGANPGWHYLGVVDYSGTSGGTNDGRWMQLWTQGDSDLTQDQLNVDTKLANAAGGDLPDFAVMGGYLGMVDGQGRSLGGDNVYGAIRTITEENITDVALANGYNDATASEIGRAH